MVARCRHVRALPKEAQGRKTLAAALPTETALAVTEAGLPPELDGPHSRRTPKHLLTKERGGARETLGAQGELLGRPET